MNLDAVGIQGITAANVESMTTKKVLSVTTPVRASKGGFHAAKKFDPYFEGTIRAKGDLPATYDLGTDGGLDIAHFTGGKTTILDVEEMEKHDDYNGYSIGWINRPAA